MRIAGIAYVVSSLFCAHLSLAATLDVVGGSLRGASGVDVAGAFYDVEFVEGTCVALFGGCDEASDFPFTDADSQLAAQALLDQVFLDGPLGAFDTSPELTQGCSDSALCGAVVPYYSTTLSLVQIDVFALNSTSTGPPDDAVFHSVVFLDPSSLDTTSDPQLVYARWSASAVPEPSASLLVALGWLGLTSVCSATRPRQRRSSGVPRPRTAAAQRALDESP